MTFIFGNCMLETWRDIFYYEMNLGIQMIAKSIYHGVESILCYGCMKTKVMAIIAIFFHRNVTLFNGV